MIYRKYRPRYRKASSELEDPEVYVGLLWVIPIATIAISLVVMGVALGLVLSHFVTGGR